MYRPNVCVFLFNEKMEFLGCQRMKTDHFQCVQGGIEACDVDIRLAALREVEEEIGLKPQDLIFVQEIPPPNGDPMKFAYTLASNANLRRFGYVGQKQRILLFFTPSENISKVVLIPPPELHASQEFRKVEWMPIEQLIAKSLPEKVHIFKAVGEVAPGIARAFLKKRGLLAEPQGAAKY
ncbi:NUDIX hydrolase dihydroneopterin triphosphate pyrophosphohydrolase/hydrolase [Leishmania infantum JPCM5]|uniref:Nudix_hydrolase_2_-_putative n=4 Tax=Leishmania donovani species complex TaxID=38574 RepID=A0A6L0WPQ6_LEIIN|nr:NUDIX hydrolase dihydroneopterin triphosphate pyrophosphohydrolase/hydrolase [Leishmania infantum JPCM5]CAC9442742.1 Nudix_hydrolase_2_-_putative [Leishmania infantum]CAM65325.1 NUDIX hydrolase dihydroneopterin triphosphate pyrophosphohydrolase/hydrolase [Leishmania infantum JPCM5]SUZ38930.1 Nudix_hydrolase_2_-_putative [Leishmania infantum]VDZ41882.1 Nudix_hydrolase_2_putative/GeneDB:LmjF.05.0090 [Leishmania donovani]|eukprot:XP_001462979.1 NUDIX hydrolase dihydroneopterin triphosphate pyrophosphohydrolase/hydrolase [Leishmania infantum JPCM5]